MNSLAAKNATQDVVELDRRKTPKKLPPQPYGTAPTSQCPSHTSADILTWTVLTTAHVLRKFKNASPSLIIHLHPSYFRFDQQDGSFGYNSPMRVFLEHVRASTIPHDMLEELFASQVKFYDGERSRAVRRMFSQQSAVRRQ